MTLLRTESLVKEYRPWFGTNHGRRVVDGVDLRVNQGEIVGLLGPNGAGKTTSFYMIVGIVRPTSGYVFLGKDDMTRWPMYRRARQGLGYLAQEPSVFRKLTVEQNLDAILETLSLTEEERQERREQLLRDLNLTSLRDQLAYTLSGGERRRLEISRALTTKPLFLLLDEPFSGIDPIRVNEIQQILLKLKEKGLGILMTDHNVRETLAVVDRAYLICEGKVLREGTSEFLLKDTVSRDLYLGHRFTL